MIRLAIIDDEDLARKRIRRLLAAHSDTQIVGEAACGESGSALISEKQPDLVFLDIDMPGLTGFELLHQVIPRKPVVIFSTAYPNFALRAFEVDAADYLLKPYDQERFDRALAKARREVAEDIQLNGDPQFITSLQITNRGILHQISLHAVQYIEAYGNYLKLHTTDAFYVYRCSMSQLEADLDPSRFMRIHRSFIVNVDHITDVRYLGKGEYKLRVGETVELGTGRKYHQRIQNYLKVKVG